MNVTRTSDFFTAQELAKRWRVSVGRLATLRSEGKGCAYVKLGGRILYAADDIHEYEKLGRVAAGGDLL